ncbi:MAG: Ribonuclease P protein component [Candidatus Uhrbacteria bacterium GW2011_GWD2_52_7]|uniref:Ribonuclease P protein component n=1 Tax=Candidatus Uhrbacteria bacterium GW2011_GWD2_52_7 TaxID=1618989 RepID=A0A0G1XC86_9BACT|nr:MAG: Ribonuclease P protein component [Candidatus Uhrbacteria bacterium GW2011_GWD2_52_7]
MLPPLHRLRLDNDIKRVLKSKSGAFDPVCGIKLTKNNLAVSRFAIVVSNKVSKSAVQRNALRRQYRDIIHRSLAQIAPGFDVILLVSKPAIVSDYAEKEVKLRSAMKRARLL